MTNSDYTTLLLCIHGYTDNIIIEQENARFGCTNYIISAHNPDIDDDIYADCESMPHAITTLCNHFYENNVKPNYEWSFIKTSIISDRQKRDEFISRMRSKNKKINNYVKDTHWITELFDKYHPCNGCVLNKHEYNDTIHNNCFEAHAMRCEYLKTFVSIIKEMYANYKNVENIDTYDSILKNNYGKTH